jgi:hypothetical protein
VVEAKREALGDRWCFQCRKRVPFVLVVKRYDCEPHEDPYGPWGSIQCEQRGHDDGDMFPGRYRVWGDE